MKSDTYMAGTIANLLVLKTRSGAKLGFGCLLVSIFLIVSASSLSAAQYVQAWTQRYPAASGRKVVVDSQGSAIAAVQVYPSVWMVIKYSNTGIPVWTNLPGVYGSTIQGVTVDGQDNVYVTGAGASSLNPMTPSDYLTTAYSSQGAPLWTNYYDGGVNLADGGAGIAVGSNGVVYVTGYSGRNIPGHYSSFLTFAFTGSGTPLWTNTFSGGVLENLTDCKPTALTVDALGNVYVIGHDVQYFQGPAPGYAIAAYSPVGIPLWTKYCGGCGMGQDSPMCIAAGRDGNLYSVMQGSGGGHVVSAYSAGGSNLWATPGGLLYPQNSSANSLALATNGNVYVGGYASRAGSGFDFMTAAYSHAGTPLWTNFYNGPANTNDYSQALAVGESGNVYVAGFVSTSNGIYGWLTLAYSSSGTPLWTNRFDEPGGSQAFAMALDRQENIYVTGQSAGDCVIIKYVAAPAISLSGATVSNSVYRITINAPTNITFRLESSTNLESWVTLTNYNSVTSTPVQYTETQTSSFPSRFYRAVWTP